MGRRVQKVVSTWNGSEYVESTEKLFVYDGWNLIEEITVVGETETSKYYVWGLDLSQSLQGAGGVGGLLAVVDGADTYHVNYDANGNVSQLVNAADGTIAAHYEYDPFGKLNYSSGSLANENAFRFSTKYFDDEYELYYYGYRYYSTELGRWINRDPLGENGGLNLYAFILNDSINSIDILGLVIDDDGYLYIGDWYDGPKLSDVSATPTGEKIPFGKKKGWNKIGITGEFYKVKFDISGKLHCEKYCGKKLIKEWDVPYSLPLSKKVGVGVGIKLKIPYAWIVTILKGGKWTYDHRKEISEGIKYATLINAAREKYEGQINKAIGVLGRIEVADNICKFSSVPQDVLNEINNLWMQ